MMLTIDVMTFQIQGPDNCFIFSTMRKPSNRLMPYSQRR